MNASIDAGIAMKSTSKSSPKPGRDTARPPGQTLKVTLPGKAYQRGSRWWWCVKLPGEEKAKAHPLKAKQAKAAVADRRAAEEVALEMWGQAIRAETEKHVRAENSRTIARLKAQFLDKVRQFSEIVENTKARVQAEAQARAEAEEKLKRITEGAAVPTRPCDCCGAPRIPAANLKRIDSGQLLCPRCLAALRAEVAQAGAQALAGCSV